MKHTSLFCAVALAAAMSTQAFAKVDTNDFVSLNFDAWDTSSSTYVTNLNPIGWSWTSSEDASEVVAGPLTATESVKGAANTPKHLELHTEGGELVWNPATAAGKSITEKKALIEMKVRLVASDTAPEIKVPGTNTEDDSVHAAVYLHEDENTHDADLWAWGYDRIGETNLWIKLVDNHTSGFANLTNGCMMALRVILDYQTKEAQYEGALLANPNGEPTYTDLYTGTIPMANPGTIVSEDGKDKLRTIAFKGTGGVDDLFVKEIEETPSKATIQYELWDLEYGFISPAATNTIDTAKENSTSTFSPDYWQDMVDNGLVLLSAELFDITQAGTTNGPLEWANAPVFNDGNMDITTNNYQFVAESTYLVKVTVGEPIVTYTVTFDKNNNSATGSMSDQTFTNNVAQNLKANGFALEGYTFAGWATSSAGEVVYADGASVTLSGANLTLYAKWTENAPVSAYVGPKSGHVQVLAAADETAYESASGKEYVPLSFTSFSVSGSAVTAGLAGTFLVDSGESSVATFVLVTQTTLGGAEDKQTVTGTLTVTGENTATLTFTMPQGDTARFIKGLYVADPQN